MNQNVVIIAIEGNIGGTKSTFLTELKNEIKDNSIYFLDEPVAIWDTIRTQDGKNILQWFYEDKMKYALVMQLTALVTRHVIISDAVKSGAKFIIMERCLKTDSEVFAASLKEQGYFNEIEWQVYKQWNRQFLDQNPISGLIYFTTTPEDCLRNIKVRGRPGEEFIDLALLESYDRFHKKYVSEFEPHANVLKLDFNMNVSEKMKIARDFLKSFETTGS